MKQTIAVVLALIGAFATYSYWPELAAEIPTDLDVASDGWRYLATVVAGVLIWMLFSPRSRRRPRRRPIRSGSGWPKEGEYWMVLVPYADGSGAKDRPCLVFKERGSICDVLYITSQDKSGDNCYFKIDNFQWSGRVSNWESWMRIAQRNGRDPAMQVPTHNFRRRLGRFTLPDGRVLITLAGINRAGPVQSDSLSTQFGPSAQHWATLGLAAHPGGFLRQAEHPVGAANPAGFGVSAGHAFNGTADGVRVDLGPDAQLEATISERHPWSRRRFGGSSWFQSVPGLNQYWHPWLLSATAQGEAIIDGETWNLDGATVYAEKNWGKGGFPDSWWWGQAQAFDDGSDASVAFAGGEVTAGPLRTEVTGLVVRLPGGKLIRLGNPVTSPVRARVTDETWSLHGRNGLWDVQIEATAPLGDAHVLPVPLPAERRNTPGAIEQLGGDLRIAVHRRGKLVWRSRSRRAGLEHGGLDRAEAELRRRTTFGR